MAVWVMVQATVPRVVTRNSNHPSMEHSTSRLLIKVVAVATIALGIFWLYLQYVSPLSQTAVRQSDPTAGISDLVLNGNIDEVIARAQAIRNASSDPVVLNNARNLEAAGRYLTGDLEERLAAIDLLKQNYLDPNVAPQGKAGVINKLLGYISNSREQAVFEKIFEGQPFAGFREEDDYTGSIHNLAEQSVRLYPTSYAVFQSSLHDIAPIINYDKTYNITAPEKQKHVDALIRSLDRAERLFADEAGQGTAGLSVRSPASYYYWRGFLYAVISSVRPEYLPKSKEAYDSLVRYYQATKNQDGQNIAYVQILVPYAYSGYANALAWADPVKYKKEIIEQLDLYMAEVKGNEKIHEGGVIAHYKSVGKSTTATQAYSMANYKRLAKIYPKFETFLAGYGLELK